MEISAATLDEIFLPYFEALEAGKVVSIVDFNWVFDFRNKSGPLTKHELEHIINRQIQLNRIEVISESEFKVVSSGTPQGPYIANQEVVDNAAAEYSRQFWEKYNAVKDD